MSSLTYSSRYAFPFLCWKDSPLLCICDLLTYCSVYKCKKPASVKCLYLRSDRSGAARPLLPAALPVLQIIKKGNKTMDAGFNKHVQIYFHFMSYKQ